MMTHQRALHWPFESWLGKKCILWPINLNWSFCLTLPQICVGGTMMDSLGDYWKWCYWNHSKWIAFYVRIIQVISYNVSYVSQSPLIDTGSIGWLRLISGLPTLWGDSLMNAN